MEIQYRDSITYPFITLRSDGKAYYKESMHEIPAMNAHSLSVRGPVIYIRMSHRSYHISLARLIYEAFIHKQPLHRDVHLEFVNGDENDCSAGNITRYKKVICKRKEKAKKMKQGAMPGHSELYDWNGGDSIYC